MVLLCFSFSPVWASFCSATRWIIIFIFLCFPNFLLINHNFLWPHFVGWPLSIWLGFTYRSFYFESHCTRLIHLHRAAPSVDAASRTDWLKRCLLQGGWLWPTCLWLTCLVKRVIVLSSKVLPNPNSLMFASSNKMGWAFSWSVLYDY